MNQTILLVDDTPTLLKLNQAIFEVAGYQVHTAMDGMEALEVLSRHRIALVISDVLMPNMDGYSLCYEIRKDERFREIPIIIYSATYTSHSDESLAKEIGANVFIRKPASSHFLLKTVSEILNNPENYRSRSVKKTELSDIMRQYSSRLIEKLEQKNEELEKAHDELIKSEKRFRALVENNFEAIVLLDDQGRVTYVSPGTERLMGYSSQEFIGTDGSVYFHPDEMDIVYNRMSEALRNPGKPVFSTNRVRHKDGHYIWTEGTTTNFLHDPNVRSFVGNFRDITERREAEEMIKKSEANLKAIFETSSESLILTDTEGVIKEINENARRTNLLTCKDEMQPGKKMIDFIDAARVAEFREMIDRVLQGEHVQYDQTFYDFEGNYHCFDFSINPVWEAGTVTSICYNGRDITERKVAEAKIIKGNRLYAFISAINQTIVHVSDENALFEGACRIAFEIGKFKVAWIGIFDIHESRVNLAVSYGLSAEIKSVLSGAALTKEGAHAFVAQHGRYYMSNDAGSDLRLRSWEPYIAGFGIRSCIVLPIFKEGVIYATYNLCSSERGFFDDQEIEMLVEIANDLSFALDIFAKEAGRKDAESKLRHSELRLQQAQEKAHIGNWELEFATGNSTWSDEQCRIYGISTTDNLQSFESWLSFVHPEDREYVRNTVLGSRETANGTSFYHRIVRRDGTTRYLHALNDYQKAANGRPVSIYGISHDITEQKEAELKIIHLNRLYSFISQINQAIVRNTDEQDILNEACRIAVGYGDFMMAWVGALDLKENKVHIQAYCGMAPEDVPKFEGAHIKDLVSVQHILETDSYFLCNDIQSEKDLGVWAPFARGRNLCSIMVLPIRKSGKLYATFNLYAGEKNIFNKEEIELLEEISNDISFALDAFEKEARKKEMEIKVQESEMHLKQAQAIAHFGSWTLDFETRIVNWSEEACRIYGLDPEEYIQTYDSWLSFIHPDDLDFVLKISRENEDAYNNFAFHHRIVRRNGDIRYIYSQAQFQFEDGKPKGLYGVAHDETDIREAEKALEQSEANLRLIMDLIPQAIFAKDQDGKYLFVNKGFAALYGLPADQIINQGVLATIPEKSEAQKFLVEDRNVILSGQPRTIAEDLFTDYLGRKRIFFTLKVPFTIAGTNEKAVLGIAMDITDLKKAEAERTKMIENILQRNKDLEQFSYIISHNLRAPVANIMGLAEASELPGLQEQDRKELMSAIGVSSKKLDAVIMDLNYILQVKEGILEQEELVQFIELVNDIKLSINNMIHSDNVKIKCDFTDFPEIFSLKSYLYSIFYNLITNSIKYRQPGIPPVIEITSIKHPEIIELVFSDNGLGIDLEKKGDQVFGLYKRFHTFAEGRGMGLFLVKTQVQALGGSITIQSAVNKGTEFRIRFNNN